MSGRVFWGPYFVPLVDLNMTCDYVDVSKDVTQYLSICIAYISIDIYVCLYVSTYLSICLSTYRSAGSSARAAHEDAGGELLKSGEPPSSLQSKESPRFPLQGFSKEDVDTGRGIDVDSDMIVEYLFMASPSV